MLMCDPPLSPRVARVFCALPTSQDAAILQANDAVTGCFKRRAKSAALGFNAGAVHQFTVEVTREERKDVFFAHHCSAGPC